jgi:hypothetical protein
MIAAPALAGLGRCSVQFQAEDGIERAVSEGRRARQPASGRNSLFRVRAPQGGPNTVDAQIDTDDLDHREPPSSSGSSASSRGSRVIVPPLHTW